MERYQKLYLMEISDYEIVAQTYLPNDNAQEAAM